ncbi:hypothetical protein D3C75_1213020 [compost metagenome]
MRNFGLGVLFAVAVFGWIGRMDYQDELKQQALYCQMVRDGLWGDYNGNYTKICPTPNDRSVLPAQVSPYSGATVPAQPRFGSQVL